MNVPYTISKKKRYKAYRQGKRGEYWAVCILMLKGYKILKTRYLCKSGEIDIIAKRKQSLIFIEVKTYYKLEQGFEAITHTKKTKIHRAAKYFLTQNPQFSTYNYVYDLFLVGRYFRFLHIKNAWLLG